VTRIGGEGLAAGGPLCTPPVLSVGTVTLRSESPISTFKFGKLGTRTVRHLTAHWQTPGRRRVGPSGTQLAEGAWALAVALLLVAAGDGVSSSRVSSPENLNRSRIGPGWRCSRPICAHVRYYLATSNIQYVADVLEERAFAHTRR
jgi:hypothetical protein